MEEIYIEELRQALKIFLMMNEEARKKIIDKMIHNNALLSPREQKILEMRFGLKNGKKYTLKETAKEYDITIERVRKIEAKAVDKIKYSIS